MDESDEYLSDEYYFNFQLISCFITVKHKL